MLRIGFWIISRLPALISALVRHMHLGGRREGGRRKGGGRGQQEMAGGRGESGRKRSMRERCAPGFDLGF
jgi:hypothetical protein